MNEMLKFEVNAYVPAFLINLHNFLEGTRQVSKVKLNDNWSVLCTRNEDASASIGIHRENMNGEFSVFGELKLKESDVVQWEKKFSRLIKTESSFAEIDSNINLITFFFTTHHYALHGTVNISYTSDIQASQLESKSRIQLNSSVALLNDLQQLLTKDSFLADIIFKCGDASIPAHKCILSARSPVFAAMFAHPMKENITKEVHITDFDEHTVRAMLDYIYTGRTPDFIFLDAENLFKAADKYLLKDLKAVCSYFLFLKSQVSYQNVWSILVLGDFLDQDMKSFALDYICKTYDKFSVLENVKEWKELRKENSALAVEVLESLHKYREEKQ